MLSYFTLLLLFGVTQGAPSKRQFAICLEMCTPRSCPAGYSCISNGCGHSCEPKLTLLGKRQIGSGCDETCSATGSGLLGSCPSGYQCKFDGCGHTCHPVTRGSDSKLLNHLLNNNCPPVLCELYCPNGFATGANGCPTCTCNQQGLPVDLQKYLQSLG